MAATMSFSLPEHWKELRAARQHQSQCAQDIEAIKSTCAAQHGNDTIKHITQCPECYPKVVDRMLQRFHHDDDNQRHEWFAQRKAFIVGLEAQFAKVKDKTLDLASIEQSLDIEKEAWYRGLLRKHYESFILSDNGVSAEELKAAMEDSDHSRDELVAMVWKSIGSPDDWEKRLDIFMEKLSKIQTPAELKNLYVDEFFKDRTTGETIEGAQQYLDRYLQAPSSTEAEVQTSLADVIASIISVQRDGKSSQGQRDAHQARLDELRRAKTAFEHNKAMTKAQQQSAAQAAAVGDQLYDLPPCAVCAGVVAATDVLSCPVCQVVCQMGGDRTMTVYCSEECHDKGQDSHVEKEHDCAAGAKCVRETDSDAEMEDETTGPVACNECLAPEQQPKRATLYCSPRCAAVNYREHREAQHRVKLEEGEDTEPYVTPLQKVIEEVFAKKNPGLKYSWM